MELQKKKDEGDRSFRIYLIFILTVVLILLLAEYYFQKDASFSIQKDCSALEEVLSLQSENKTIECSSIIATIAGGEITADEFKAYMERRSGGYRGQFSTPEQKQALLKEFLNNKLQILQAYQLGLDSDPKVVAKLERVMLAKLRERELDKQLKAIEVSDFDIAQYYQDHLQDYTAPAMSRGAIIRFVVPEYASEDKKAVIREKANNVLALAHTIPDSVRGFGALAVEHSEHQSTRYRGGDIGWVHDATPPHTIDPAVKKALLALNNPGELTPLVAADDGYYLVKLIEIRPAKTRALATLSPKIRQQLLHRKRQQVEASWLASLQSADMPIEINHTLLQSLPSTEGRAADQQYAQAPALPSR